MKRYKMPFSTDKKVTFNQPEMTIRTEYKDSSSNTKLTLSSLMQRRLSNANANIMNTRNYLNETITNSKAHFSSRSQSISKKTYNSNSSNILNKT